MFNLTITDSSGSICVIPLSPLEHLVRLFSGELFAQFAIALEQTSGIVTPALSALALLVIFCGHGAVWIFSQRYSQPLWITQRYKGKKFKKSPCSFFLVFGAPHSCLFVDLRTLAALFLMSFNSISSAVIRFFNCVQLNSGTRVVASVPSLSCDSGEYLQVRIGI